MPPKPTSQHRNSRGRRAASTPSGSNSGSRSLKACQEGNAEQIRSSSGHPTQTSADPSAKEHQLATKPATLRVLVADDHPLVREGVIAAVNRQPDMRVVAEASNGREAAEQFLANKPDIALLDLRMPLMNGVEAAAAICQKQPDAKIVIVSSYQSEEEVYRSMRVGAQGYILKDAPVDDLLACIRAVVEGRTWIPPGVGAKLARRVTGQELTGREVEVLQAMAHGRSNKEIGVLLNITESTVKVHVSHVLDKLKAGGRAEAISLALKRGLVSLDAPQG